MRISIATRVTIACLTVLAFSLILLGVGLVVANRVWSANSNLELLSDSLRRVSHHERAQDELRLAIGRATRAAEAGEPVREVRWAALSHDIDSFERLSRSIGTAPEALPASVRAALSEVRRTTVEFVPSSRALVVLARSEPASVQTAMPRFLEALKRMEQAHMEARDVVTQEITATARRNAYEGTRNIVGVLVAGLLIVAVFFWMSVWLRRHLLSPIASIAARLRDVDSAQTDTGILWLRRPDELGDLARGLAEYRSAYEERRAAERRAEFLAQHDALTGIANRLLFERRLSEALARARQTGESVAVLAIDLDNFKAINDRHGHVGGDRTLQRMARLLSDCVRDDDLVARLGGDEFAIIQVTGAQPEAAEALVDRLFEVSAATANEEIAIRMSIGVAVSEPGWSEEDLHHLADLALYRAKAAGRNTARFFDAVLKEQEKLRLSLARDLEQALAANELYLEFQPVADAPSLQVRGYEALLRWRHPRLGDIAPARFIPIAEANGLIDPIGLWVADRAMAAAATWAPGLSLALNLSPVQFRRPGLATRFLEVAQRHGLAPQRLEFEVTESATLLGFERDAALNTLKALRAAGARVAMDDFGTGYSSLSNLKDFPFDKLKIDRSFVAAMREDGPSASIVRAAISLGSSLGLTTVAEGVEDEAQLAELQRWGCDQVQGYLIGRPQRMVAPAHLDAPVACRGDRGRHAAPGR